LTGHTSRTAALQTLTSFAPPREPYRPDAPIVKPGATNEREHHLRAAAHELKTPLTRLRVVIEGAGTTLPDQTAATLLGILDQASRAAHTACG